MDKWRIYVEEALTQLAFAKQCFRDFEAALDRSDVQQVFFHLHHFIVHVANVDKLLDPKPGTPRHSLISSHVDLTGIDLKPFRRLRNHLEHFDERLDNWVAKYEGHAFLDMNIVTGAKGFPSKAFLRALDGDVFKFHGEDYALTPLRRAVDELYARLAHNDG
jgi:hypothetical protein